MSDPEPTAESELVERLRSIDVRAPEDLHRRVRELVAERSPEARGHGWSRPARRGPTARAPRLGLGIAALAAIVVAVVLSLSGGGGSTLTVHRATALTLSAATMPAPAESPDGRGTLTAAVDGVSFPYWDARFGWRASGQRSDRIDGRSVRTVFYSSSQGGRVGYAIVAGTPAPAIGGGEVVSRDGTSFRLHSEGDVSSVTWLRDGRLCVVAGRGVSSATLLALASWHERGTST
jgi:hypothetical protein